LFFHCADHFNDIRANFSNENHNFAIISPGKRLGKNFVLAKWRRVLLMQDS